MPKSLALSIAGFMIALSGSIVTLNGCARGPESGPAVRRSDDSTAAGPANVAVRQLADDMWAETLEDSTYFRLQQGLPIEKFEDFTLEAHRERLADKAAWRTRLAAIDWSTLSGNGLITYEILAFELQDYGANDDDYWLMFDITPYLAPYDFTFARQALALQEITDAADADRYLRLVGEYADMIDHLIEKLEGQVVREIYLPKPALTSVRATWEGIRNAAPDAIEVAPERLVSLSNEERETFLIALDTLISNRVVPRFGDLLNTIGNEYEAAAPQSVGLGQYPGGSDFYERRVRIETTLDLTPAEIHDRGGKAVAEIAARMKDIRDRLGFEGTAREFHEQLKRDRRFIAANPADVEGRYLSYIERIEPKLGSYFRSRPEAAHGVRRLPPAAEPGMTFGYYQPPIVGEAVGFYNYNGSDLENRSLIGAGSLIYHELVPGHHFHVGLQQENESLPAYRRNYLVAAFTEGWAEYAASLGIEMGMYEDPYDLYGRYLMEIFLASRLVVDTGMHALGWSLEDARGYMSEYLFLSQVEIASETLRYSTSKPAQALAYRLGYEKFWELRHRAERALGDRFDVRDYHEVILSYGARPLAVVEATVDRYIEAAAAE